MEGLEAILLVLLLYLSLGEFCQEKENSNDYRVL